MKDEYTCAACGKTFARTRSDEQAYAEAKKRWLNRLEPMPQAAIVCDDCHAAIVEHAVREGAL